MRARLPLALLLLLSACATPEAQLRTGLVHAGLPEGPSACMARDMAPRLSLPQLLRLRDLSRAGAPDPMQGGAERYLHRVRALGDTALWDIASRAAARCVLGL